MKPHKRSIDASLNYYRIYTATLLDVPFWIYFIAYAIFQVSLKFIKIGKGNVWKCHYVSPLIRGAIKRYVNNINEGRGLISFLLADYSNLLKRESGIKREHCKNLILFSNPRDKIRKLLTTWGRDTCAIIKHPSLSFTAHVENERIIIREEVIIIKKTNRLQGLGSRGKRRNVKAIFRKYVKQTNNVVQPT